MHLHTNMMTQNHAGRIWSLRIYMGFDAKWHMEWRLCRRSLPARPDAVVLIEAQREGPGRATKPQTLRMVCELENGMLLAANR
jgi:hypothetical protein